MNTILLLGGYGFIGSNIMDFIDRHLSHLYEVILFDKVANHPFGLDFKCVKKKYFGDFSDITCLEPILKENQIDLVFHCINTTVPSTSYNIRFDIESNLVSTVNFINLMVETKIKNIVYLSSGGAIYGNTEGKKIESAPNYPHSSYGIVKLAIEKYLMLYSYESKINPLILRLSNPYGPFHYSMKQGILNVALRSSLEKKQFSVWGDGENSKDYIFVEDVIEIIFKLLELKIQNEIINIGSGNLIKVNQILALIKNIYPHFTWNYIQPKTFDVSHFELDIRKLKHIIGNYSFTPIEDGIIKTNNWIINSSLNC